MQLMLIDKAGRDSETERPAARRLSAVATIAAADCPVISKKRLCAGRTISAIPALLLGSGGVNALMKSPVVLEGTVRLGYPASALPIIGILELACIILYVIPRTSIPGALLLTAYFGGATASHVRIGDPTFLAPIVVGMLVWAGLLLRDDRLREFSKKIFSTLRKVQQKCDS
jgi:DoxX-like family